MRHMTTIVAILLTGQLLAAADATTPESLPATGFGAFANVHELGGVDNWRAHVQLMKASGMNTFVPWCRSPEDLAAQIDIAVEEGMLASSVPMLVILELGASWYEQNVPDWEQVKAADTHPLPGIGRGAVHGNVVALKKARQLAKHPESWPELVAYGYDEPEVEANQNVGQLTAAYNALGVRSGTGCVYPNVKACAPLLDIVAVAVIIGGDLRGCKQAIESAGNEFWEYHTTAPRLTPEMVRWQLGYFVWQTQPRCHLCWNWAGFIKGDMANPQGKDVLRAYAQGVADFGTLTVAESEAPKIPALSAYLEELRRGYDWEGLPVAPWREKQHEAVPDIDLNAMVDTIRRLREEPPSAAP